MLQHPPYSTDFTLSHYRLFSPLGNKKPAVHYTNDKALENAVHQWLQNMDGNF